MLQCNIPVNFSIKTGEIVNAAVTINILVTLIRIKFTKSI